SVIEACLQKDRDKRLQTASELSLRLSAIARRLSTDPALLGRTPRRRATDRLPNERPTRESLADTGMPLLMRVWLMLGLPAPTRGTVGIAAALLGTALGFAAARHLEPPKPVIIQAAAPVAPPVAPQASAAQAALERPVSPAVPAPAGVVRSPAVEDDLTRAVAKGLEGKK